MNAYQTNIFAGVCNPYPHTFGIFSVLTPDYVRNIDAEIMKEVVPFMKKFESLSRVIREEAVHKAATLTPREYGDELADAWKVHNLLAIRIDDFLVLQMTDRTFEVDRSNISIVREFMSLALDAERKKRVLSAGVKHLLEPWISHLQTRTGFSPEDMAKALTVEIPNYYVLYEARHVEYWHDLILNDGHSDLADSLRVDFHASNRLVMEGRLSKSGYPGRNFKMLSEMLGRYREMEKRLRDMSLEGEYLALENDLLKSIRYVITYDNFVEYSFGDNLFGIPDLLFRKFTIASLIRQGFLEKREAILHYSDEELMEALKKYEN